LATTKQDISEWFDRGVRYMATHLIVVCDTFDYEDYPVFVSREESVTERVNYFNGPNMQKVMEVYNLSLDKEEQLNTHMAWNI
jgi:hypothetical protein